MKKIEIKKHFSKKIKLNKKGLINQPDPLITILRIYNLSTWDSI